MYKKISVSSIFFYLLNFIGIAVYFLFNKKANADSPLIMLPFFIAFILIFFSILKWLLRGEKSVSIQLCSISFFTFFSIVLLLIHSWFITYPNAYGYIERFNSFRRNFGILIFFFAFVGLDYFCDLKSITLKGYLKFVTFLVGIEAIVELVLLNLRVITYADLPVKIGTEYLGVVGATYRPYGFVGATSSLGTLLLILFYLSYGLKNELPRWVWMLSLFAFLVTFSLTSYSILIFICFFELLFKKISIQKIITALVAFPLLVASLYYIMMYFFPEKFSTGILDHYFEVLYIVYGYEIENYISHMSHTNMFFDILLGAQKFDLSFSILSQDWPYVTWLAEVGILGIFVYGYFIVKLISRLQCVMQKKYINAVIICLFAGMMHYPLLIFIPTQMILGSILYFAYKMPGKVLVDNNDCVSERA